MTTIGLSTTHAEELQGREDIEENAEHEPSASVEEQRTGITLCLSGGGFRAALFHLGALRRLNELGILSQLTTISSVSGEYYGSPPY